MTALISTLKNFRSLSAYKPTTQEKNCACTVCTAWRRNMK
jgi:hypothetical protein